MGCRIQPKYQNSGRGELMVERTPASASQSGTAFQPVTGHDNQGGDDAGWHAAVNITQGSNSPLVKPTTVADASSGKPPLDIRFAALSVASPATAPMRVLPSQKDQSGPDDLTKADPPAKSAHKV
jgi:hypothetical protein